jgi:uncharacterized lipoprotein
VKRTFTLVFVVLAAGSVLSGCSFMRNKFGNKSEAYKSSVQTRPLEVPPDLEQPNSTGTLVIPETAGRATEATSVIERAPSMSVLASSEASSSEEFVVEDSVESTWTRVGLALERSGAANIESRDAKAYSYEVRTSGTTRKPAGWFKRAITFGKSSGKQVRTPIALRVRVVDAANGSKVLVEGGSSDASREAARRVLEALRQRMS